MEMESCVPPGFRFHPTEEELVGYYLKRKVNSLKIDLEVIVDLDLYRMEPWDIQDGCRLGYEEQNEWYFFSHKDKKYPTGTRTNRATAAGFWKATGRDKAVLSKNRIIGMRKTLVFYQGRAPNGRKTDWIMHEYRLQTSEHAPPQEEGWVVCRAFKKPTPNHKQGFEAWSRGYYVNRDNGNFRLPSCSDTVLLGPNHMVYSEDQDHMSTHQANLEKQLVDLPQLHSPTLSTAKDDSDQHKIGITDKDCHGERSSTEGSGQYVDWKIFDDLLATQLVDPSSSSFAHSNLPLVSQDYDLSALNHGTHDLFTYFPHDL